ILQIASQQWLMSESKILQGDFLKTDFQKIIEPQFAIIGNFPYNISSQIIFKVLENKVRIPLLVGMFQREMAQRIVAHHGNRDYGIISIFTQAYYHAEYLFSVDATKFLPMPKVQSAVIRLKAKRPEKDWDEELFRKIVKLAFNQRRKKLCNAVASLNGAPAVLEKNKWADLRAEALSVEDYIQFTLDMQNEKGINNG
ncbi:MAG: ribosomal RNA small subunit methyltransferase A, partial [Sediminibacterium sp.]